MPAACENSGHLLACLLVDLFACSLGQPVDLLPLCVYMFINASVRPSSALHAILDLHVQGVS